MAALALLLVQGVSAAAASGSCPPCDGADDILKPCNTSLQMQNWPGTFVYQPLAAQAQCACNQNFYDQMVSCLACQSSSSAKLSIKALPDYKLVCQSLGQTSFPPVYIPGGAQSSPSTPSPTTDPNQSSGSHSGGSGASHSSLSSGAIAGIVVSAIALIVALLVAGYVFTRRKREMARQKEEDDLYKYQGATRNSYMEAPLPQYTGMIQSSLPSLPQLTNLRVMNPDNDEDEDNYGIGAKFQNGNGFDAPRTSSPGWRRGSFDDD
ncbi:hypothetical protein BGZ98_001433 [Dissophora globulifera]|nr:hypothetical protein BGZ98_001433 [Dissophora globulifera]